MVVRSRSLRTWSVSVLTMPSSVRGGRFSGQTNLQRGHVMYKTYDVHSKLIQDETYAFDFEAIFILQKYLHSYFYPYVAITHPSASSVASKLGDRMAEPSSWREFTWYLGTNSEVKVTESRYYLQSRDHLE